jgi:DNA-binding HxlR family transcriptional regulator
MRAVGGISQRVLVTTLRNLERDGIVTRRIYSEVPPKVEYTRRCGGLFIPVEQLVRWLLNERPEIEKSHRSCDQRIRKE